MTCLRRIALPPCAATAVLAMAVIAAACAAPTPTPAPTATATPAPTATPDDSNLTGILATTDLSVGDNRVAFLLLSPRALIDVPQVTVRSALAAGGGLDVADEEVATAAFYEWPYGTRGNYVTQLTFDRPGEWELLVEADGPEGPLGTARIPLHVKERSFTPAVGSLPPMDVNRTAADVADLGHLTTWFTPDPELYQATVPQLAGDGLPSVVVFASPALCTSPTCGPQVETVSNVKDEYAGRVGFLHVEVYDNPHEIQGDLAAARYSPLVDAWGLSKIEDYLNESFVFILDREGRVAFKYEGYASKDELLEGLRRVL